MLAGMARLRYPGSDAEQLLLAPQDLRTADPSFVTEIYSGQFGLAGISPELNGRSPFEITPPSQAWARALHGFGWLRHLRAAGNHIAHEQAKTLFRDWVRLNRSTSGLAWRPDITGRRVIAWLSNSVIVLDTEDAESYDAFLRALTTQLRDLSASYRDAPDGLPRLVAVTALIYGGLCIAEQQAVVDRFLKPLTKELDRQILPDGGHISRNPMALVSVLLDLLPLRQCFVARDREPPAQLTEAIQRAMRALRFFRFGDGALARFNGGGATPADSLATVLAYDEMDELPAMVAQDSAYARLEQGETRLIFDFGAAPAGQLSAQAGAGCLSFEMASGLQTIIVNCGAPGPDYPEWQSFARATEAHSTLTLGGVSSGLFSQDGDARDPEEEITLSGPQDATGAVSWSGRSIEINGSHDGYGKRFGLHHSRQILIAPTGHVISGKDVLTPTGRNSDSGETVPYAIRFHLHPRIEAQLSEDGGTIMLSLPNGEVWKISSNATETRLERSVFFGDERGPEESAQVVFAGDASAGMETRIAWSIDRIDDGISANEAEPSLDEADLALEPA